MFFVEIGKNIFLLTFISEFRNLKFPELENWELKVPRTWELRNLGTSELGNLFKGIPVNCAAKYSIGPDKVMYNMF